MIAVAAEIVRFLPQLVPVRFHFGKGLPQPQQLSLQHRELEGVFVCCRLCESAASRMPAALPGRVRIDVCMGEIRADLWRKFVIIVEETLLRN